MYVTSVPFFGTGMEVLSSFLDPWELTFLIISNIHSQDTSSTA